jgi:uncharacterized protein
VSVEANPVGVHCGMRCAFCYQHPVRAASRNARPMANVPAMIAAIDRQCQEGGEHGFSLFGGEPLLARIEDLEQLFRHGLERYGRNGVQTSGADMTEEHFALFRRYQVCVGFSIEGPGELNDSRRYGTMEETRAATARSCAWLERCLAEGVSCSLIVTLHRTNASPERLPVLLEWFRRLDGLGLRDARVHALELDGGAAALRLSVDQAVEAFRAVAALERSMRGLRFDVFKDMRRLLAGDDDGVTCTWDSCDPWTTPAVRGVDAGGHRSLCQRVHKDGRQWGAAPAGPLVRQLVLASTPRSEGGCQGCRFLTSCKGQCPGTAIGGDWRKRSADCELWFRLFGHLEGELVGQGVTPVSLRPDLEMITSRMVAAWSAGRRPSNRGCIEDRYASGAPGQHVDHDDHADHDDLGPALDALAGGERCE